MPAVVCCVVKEKCVEGIDRAVRQGVREKDGGCHKASNRNFEKSVKRCS